MIPSANDLTIGSEMFHVAFRAKFQLLSVVPADLSRSTSPPLCTNYPERVQTLPSPRGLPHASTPFLYPLHLSQCTQLSAKWILPPETSGYQTLSESPGGLVKPACWLPPPVSDLVGLGWHTRICTFNKFPRILILLVQEHTLRTPALVYQFLREKNPNFFYLVSLVHNTETDIADIQTISAEWKKWVKSWIPCHFIWRWND